MNYYFSENDNKKISTQIKSEPIEFDSFNSNQLEINHNSLTIFNQEISLKREPQMQMQQTIHLIKRKYKRIHSKQKEISKKRVSPNPNPNPNPIFVVKSC